jgi:hypothetical protein
VTSSFPVACKNTLTWRAVVSNVLWRVGALFAVSLALIVSGAVALLMMCLLRLADLSEKWDGDAVGQLLLLRERMAQTMNREFRPDPDADLRRLPDGFLHGSNFSDTPFSYRKTPRLGAGLIGGNNRITNYNETQQYNPTPLGPIGP